MAKIIIFGIQDFAQLAHYYLENDSEHTVVAFSVHKQFLPENKLFQNLPVIAFETILNEYPTSEYYFFAPLAPVNMNRFRESIFVEIKLKGYRLISYISSRATIFNTEIGENCFILENNTIQPFVSIGNNVILWSGNHIGHHSIIDDHVMFTSQVVLSGHCKVKKYVTLGVNATVRDSVTLAEGTFVGMAANVIKDTDSWSIYRGNPAVKSDKSSNDL